MEADRLQQLFKALDHNNDGGLDEVSGPAGPSKPHDNEAQAARWPPKALPTRRASRPETVARRSAANEATAHVGPSCRRLSRPAAAELLCHPALLRAQAELSWLIKAVNPEVPLGEAALGLILEEVRCCGCCCASRVASSPAGGRITLHRRRRWACSTPASLGAMPQGCLSVPG